MHYPASKWRPVLDIHNRVFESRRLPLDNAAHIPKLQRCDVDMPGLITVEPVPLGAVASLRAPLIPASARNGDKWPLCQATMESISPRSNVGKEPFPTRCGGRVPEYIARTRGWERGAWARRSLPGLTRSRSGPLHSFPTKISGGAVAYSLQSSPRRWTPIGAR